ncbi:MAG: hypothetical protein FJY07_05665, partial [Bacteroidetes bacterium]|nr:hypothetical protein [Bacteroidota bacterium]
MTTCKTTFDFKNILTVFILLCCFGISFHSLGQQQNLNENDVIAKAKTLFEKKDYQNALPLYAQLVSVHPENAEYNFCLGVCTLFG